MELNEPPVVSRWLRRFDHTNDNIQLLRRRQSPFTDRRNPGRFYQTYDVFLVVLPKTSSGKDGESFHVIQLARIDARHRLLEKHALILHPYRML